MIIHTGSETTGNSSYEIDLAPQTTTFDSMLDVGQTFTDPALNLSITTLSADAAGATVSVSLGPLPCTHTSPIVSVSPSQSAVAGGALTYNVSVTNTDGRLLVRVPVAAHWVFRGLLGLHSRCGPHAC